MGERGRNSVAVIGSGVSGLSAAWALSGARRVTLYEAQARLGGHSDTFDWDGVGVDCGFIVYNERTYPNLTALFRHLGVETAASDMSFAVSIDDGDFEYAGGNLRGLVAQAGNVLRPRYWSMLKDILRFFREAPRDLERGELGSLGAYLDARGYGKAFRDDYLYPMAAAIWSTPALRVADFPAANFIRFNRNHGLLDLMNRPVWRTVAGGSRNYVAKLAAAVAEVRAGAPVRAVRRVAQGVEVIDASGEARLYDDVVIAAHADDALGLIEAPTSAESRLLGAFRYLDNAAILHTDAAAMPKRRAAWSSWNYLSRGAGADRRLTVSYWMNRLQPLGRRPDVFLSLNHDAIAPDKTLRHVSYRHPLFDAAAFAAQRELWSLQGRDGLWFCGAYFGYGFHEDGLQAGLAVAEALGGTPRPWSVEGQNDRLAL